MSGKNIVTSGCRYLFKGYLFLAALVGTVVMAWPLIILLWNAGFAPAPMPIRLPNGLTYALDINSTFAGHVIAHGNRIVIAPNVKRIMWHGKTVYGYRKGPAEEVYYFICTAGEDCIESQHYRDTEFQQLLRKKGLPEFSSRMAQSYQQLLWKQSK